MSHQANLDFLINDRVFESVCLQLFRFNFDVIEGIWPLFIATLSQELKHDQPPQRSTCGLRVTVIPLPSECSWSSGPSEVYGPDVRT